MANYYRAPSRDSVPPPMSLTQWTPFTWSSLACAQLNPTANARSAQSQYEYVHFGTSGNWRRGIGRLRWHPATLDYCQKQFQRFDLLHLLLPGISATNVCFRLIHRPAESEIFTPLLLKMDHNKCVDILRMQLVELCAAELEFIHEFLEDFPYGFYRVSFRECSLEFLQGSKPQQEYFMSFSVLWIKTDCLA